MIKEGRKIMQQAIQEHQAWKVNGFVMLGVGLATFVLGLLLLLLSGSILGAVFFVVTGLIGPGFVMVQPNEARVLIFFGKYTGSVREAGFFWVNPFTIKKRVSLRVRNFNSEKLKVNDAAGNPIIIGAVVVWKVVDSAKALFDVDNYEEFVAIQSETAIRSLASRYPYDSHADDVPSLRGIPDEVAETLKREVQERLEVAGVEVIEARISHLAYAPEIAQAMLRRQQAEAIIAARKKIVEGAVGMVEAALAHIEGQNLLQLDEERKAAMVNNLLVALVAEGDAQPVINTGTLYS
jgi:regulator of protease activity HflC (stomatin/prohibitin superfamily)